MVEGEEALIYLDALAAAWLYAAASTSSRGAARKLLDEEDLIVSPAVILELEYLREIGRLAVAGKGVVQGLSAQIGLRVCDASFPAVIEASPDQKWTRDPFDRLIVGQASLSASPLLTKDRSIRRHYRHAKW